MVCLDENGKAHTSRQLAKAYESWQQQSASICFVIGGADGLDEKIRNQARALWSLSSMTLPHALVRVFIVEALYRAQSILNNHPYHRD